MVQAYRMCGFEKFEVDSNGNAWGDGKTSDGEDKLKRKTPLSFAKHPVDGQGLTITEDRHRLLELVGRKGILIVEAFYWRLVQIAGDKEDGYRGWIVTGQLETMDAALIAKRCMLDLEQVTESLKILQTLELIEYVKCAFAKECGQPVRFEAGNVKLGDLAGSQISSDNLQESAVPSEPNIKTKELNMNKTEMAPAEKCAQNGAVKEIEESVCSISSTAEESQSESQSEEAGSKERKESRSEESESKGPEESKESAGSRGNRSLEEAIPGAEPNGVVQPTGGGIVNGALNWEIEIDRLKQTSNLKVESPECLLVGIDPEKKFASVQLIDRMMIWFRAMCPFPLRPEDAGSTQDRIQARSNVRMCMALASKAWEKDGPDGVIEIMLYMQQICVAWDRPGNSRIDSPMGMWIVRVRTWLGVIAKIGEGGCANAG